MLNQSPAERGARHLWSSLLIFDKFWVQRHLGCSVLLVAAAHDALHAGSARTNADSNRPGYTLPEMCCRTRGSMRPTSASSPRTSRPRRPAAGSAVPGPASASARWPAGTLATAAGSALARSLPAMLSAFRTKGARAAAAAASAAAARACSACSATREHNIRKKLRRKKQLQTLLTASYFSARTS